ncbi:MAG: hypothetical protein HC815_38125 [Richelia sp. RM1_1_1]|nr:hypothetical protein [Richelia sp. RM1_1_1]
MSTGDDEHKQRLSALCKRLRGEESLRSFTKKRSKELKGISFATWGSWERCQSELSRDSLERLVSFIGCSYKYFSAYLNGFITLEELLQPTPVSEIEIDNESESTLSPDAAAGWMKSLSPEEQLLVVSQGFQLLQGQLDKLVETRTTKRIELLSDLLFSKDYPDNYKIETIAKKLNMSVEFLKKLCDRVFES